MSSLAKFADLKRVRLVENLAIDEILGLWVARTQRDNVHLSPDRLNAAHSFSSDWQLIERVLDFHTIEDKEHEGKYAAIGLAKRLAELDPPEKILSLDNAAPNDILVRALSRLLREKFDGQFVPENSQIGCLAHVVNLVVQKLLTALDEAVDPAVEDDYIPNKDLPFHYNPGDDPDLTELECEVFAQEGELETEEDDAVNMMTALASEFDGMTPLQKVIFRAYNSDHSDQPHNLRTLATKICSSRQHRKRIRCSAEKASPVQLTPSGRKIAILMVVRDVRHRWNYTHAMIRRGLLLRKAIDSWVSEREELLRRLLISTEQWAFLEAVVNIFEVFTQPSLGFFPWTYEMMIKHLREWQADDNSLRSFRDAATAGLVLHLTLGMKWFRKLDAERKLDLERAHDAERAIHAKILFEHAYQSYKEIHDADKSKHLKSRIPRTVPVPARSILSWMMYVW
ncbi:hypothetical protein DFH09DRAFT_1320008 [Mycena vulgaris]|nr:hypothetical protein DFH09DRAFT_1320008 [Mycena vulgaris]